MEYLDSVIKNNINKLIQEASWAFHYGKDHDKTPYKSENKFVCYHETGQFGSGTYFSTYNGAYEKKDALEKYGNNNPNQEPNFIQINDGVYRVDLDLYKNLYKVYTERQGDVLHTMMGDLNKFYHKISGFGLGHYNKRNADYNNSVLFQRIKVNADALGLECPQYIRLIRMAQELAQNETDKRSFSTVFMEYNGFNGVNVSGVDKFDNSRHGSVIYDLSNVSDNMILLKDHSLNPSTVGYSHTNSVAKNNFDFTQTAYIDSLVDRYNPLFFDEIDDKTKFRIVKNLTQRESLPEGDLFMYKFKDYPRMINYVLRYSLKNRHLYTMWHLPY